MSTYASPNAALIQNAKRPEGWKDAAPFPPKGTTTFSRQDGLPKLPIPDFDATVAKLKRDLQALASSFDELRLCEARIDDFAKQGGFGRSLHKRLVDRNDTPSIKHWLEEFWDDSGYLKYRDTVLINVSYYYGFAHPPSHLPKTAISRAATLIRGALLERKALRQGTQPIDMNRKDPICMDTWRWMFDCCRIPGLDGSDWSVTAANPSDTGLSGHIIVLRQGKIWKVDVAASGALLSTADLEKQLEIIYNDPVEKTPEVGILTTNNRDVWAKDYAELLSISQRNASNLETIISSAFVVCLDTTQPSSRLENSKNLFHGGSKGEQLGNRWMDKPAQFVICDNGESGYVGEHSVMDGTPSVTMLDRLLTNLSRPEFDHGSAAVQPLPPPALLEWDTTPKILKGIEAARTAAEALVARQETGMLTVPYGRDEIKKFGFGPDSWTQMVIQLAYHRLLAAKGGSGRLREGGTYEAASTRGFFKGRTETIRVVTNESMDWCDAMEDKKVDHERRRELFKVATNRHRLDADDSVKAQGIDRHLFGLKNMLRKGEPAHDLFTDPLYVGSSSWILSTSAIFSSHFTRGYGWGQVMPNGFGVAYMTGFPDRLEFTITSQKNQPNAEFLRELDSAADDLKSLWEETTKKARM